MTQAKAITVVQGGLKDVQRASTIVSKIRKEIMVEGVHYGKIPGTNDKPTLFLPGMELLMRAFRVRPVYRPLTVIEDFHTPLFFYRYQCDLVWKDNDQIVEGSAIGSANSMETKWASRWVPIHQVPKKYDPETLEKKGGRVSEFAFAIEKAETSGQYGKPAEYWLAFQRGIEDGTATRIEKKTKTGKTMEAWEIDSTLYAIPNPQIFDQTNTIDKIAQKRSLSSAIKGVAGVSEYFTVDMEDRGMFAGAIEGDFEVEFNLTDPKEATLWFNKWKDRGVTADQIREALGPNREEWPRGSFIADEYVKAYIQSRAEAAVEAL